MEETIRSIPMNEKVIFTACTPSGHYQMDEIIYLRRKPGAHLPCQLPPQRKLPKWLRDSPPPTTWKPSFSLRRPVQTGSERFSERESTNRDYLKQLATADRGWKRIRINFQIGLPFETAEDREENLGFLQMILQNTKLPVSVRIGSLHSRPWTRSSGRPCCPLRNSGPSPTISSGKPGSSASKTWSGLPPVDAHVYALLSRGDRKVAAALEARLTGVGWNTAFEKAGVDMNWVFHQVEVGSQFGWDFLNMGFGYTGSPGSNQAAAALDEERR
jgi:hypothetical protein